MHMLTHHATVLPYHDCRSWMTGTASCRYCWRSTSRPTQHSRARQQRQQEQTLSSSSNRVQSWQQRQQQPAVLQAAKQRMAQACL
jgi:hypothetical protein